MLSVYFIVFGSVSKATPNEEKKREKESLKKTMLFLTIHHYRTVSLYAVILWNL